MRAQAISRDRVFYHQVGLDVLGLCRVSPLAGSSLIICDRLTFNSTKDLRMRLVHCITFATAVVASGCAAPPSYSEKALKVQVHTQMSTLLEKCQHLGPVSAMASDSFYGWQVATRAAQSDAREQVANLGGDTFVQLAVDRVSNLAAQVQGRAMKCF